ncbi:MAG: GTP-binding protein [Candidatus Lokiarchaeota archaeon]|nr:GTP-binding protein [Candidatus Lokiarchaeota archaeon]
MNRNKSISTSMLMPDKYKFKIVFIGDGYVGKTSLIRQYTQKSFEKQYIKTIGAQFSFYDKQVENNEVRSIFYDIAGQDAFKFMRKMFFKDSKAAVIVYSLVDDKMGKESFKSIKGWYTDVLKFCGSIPIAVIANKVDLSYENVVDIIDVREIIKEKEFLGYYVTSAKTGQGVKNAFNSIIEGVYYKS